MYSKLLATRPGRGSVTLFFYLFSFLFMLLFLFVSFFLFSRGGGLRPSTIRIHQSTHIRQVKMSYRGYVYTNLFGHDYSLYPSK